MVKPTSPPIIIRSLTFTTFFSTFPEELPMPISEPYIPKEYLALKINYCKQQLASLPEVEIKERKVKGSVKKVFAVKSHIYLPDSKTGVKLRAFNQKREQLLCDLSRYEGLWNSAFRGLPPPDIKPRKIIRSYLNNNKEPVIMDSAFFDGLKNDADPYYPDNKKYFYNGTYYRSAAEADVAGYYTRQGIPFKYEPEIWINGLNYPIYPDFVFLIKELDLCKFHEHFGMKNYANYAQSLQVKCSNYSNAGLVMDFDVISTYNFDSIPFDLRMLSTKINHAVYDSLFAIDIP